MPYPPRWSVLVLRGWVEAGRLRVRLLRTGTTGADEQAVAASAARAAQVVKDWLDELAPIDAAGDEWTDATETGGRRDAPRKIRRARRQPLPSVGDEATGGTDERVRGDR